MKWCPNTGCPHHRRTGERAEYQDRIEVCSDCGAALVQTTRPAAPRSAMPRALMRRLAITILSAVPLWLGSRIALPFFDQEALRFTLNLGDASLPAALSVMGLGIMPFVTGFVVVELVAMVVPPLRSRRHGDAALRAILTRASLALGVGVATAQALTLALYLESLGWSLPVVLHPGWAFRLEVIVTLVAGSCLCVALARVIDRHGFGPGFAVLICADLLSSAPRLIGDMRLLMAQGLLPPLSAGLAIAAVAIFGWATWWLLRRRGRATGALPVLLPTCGIWPLALAASLAMLPATLSNLVDTPGLVTLASRLLPGSVPYLLFELAVIALSAPLVSALCYWRRRASFGATDARATWRSAQLRSALFLLGAVGYWFAVSRLLSFPSLHALTFSLLLLVAIAADLWDELRVRRQLPDGVELLRLEEHHDVSDALEALGDQGVRGAFVQGLRFRSLTYFAAPFVPMVVMRTQER